MKRDKKIAEELGRVTGNKFRAGFLGILCEYERARAGKEDKPRPLHDVGEDGNDAQ